MAEAVRPKGKAKRRTGGKNKKAKSSDPLLEGESSAKLESEEKPIEENKEESTDSISGSLRKRGERDQSLTASEDPLNTESLKKENISCFRVLGDDKQTGDEVEETNQERKRDEKEDSEPEDLYSYAAESLEKDLKHGEATATALMVSSDFKHSGAITTASVVSSVIECHEEGACAAEKDASSGIQHSNRNQDSTVQGTSHNEEVLRKPNQSDLEDTVATETEEMIDESKGMCASQGDDSVEKFDFLPFPSKEASIDESLQETTSKDETTSCDTEQPTAPPAAEVLTPGDIDETIDPLSSNQGKLGTPVNENPEPKEQLEVMSGAITLQEVAPGEDPLFISGLKVQEQGEGDINRSAEGIKEVTSSTNSQCNKAVRTETWSMESMLPLNQKELEYYYFNSMLTQQDAFVEEFMKGNYVLDKHEFYELVSNYLRARINVGTIQTEMKGQREDYLDNVEQIWSFTQNEIPVKGQCQDDVGVKASHTFKIVEYHEGKLKAVENALSQLRNHVHSTYALVSYTSQLSRLQIEVYIHHLLNRSDLFKDVDNTISVGAHLVNTNSSVAQGDLTKLRQCISVLFAFQRRPISDSEFVENSRLWLHRMVCILLRIATLDDHMFIFQHLLRCPPGITEWATTFLQVPAPVQEAAGNRHLISMDDVPSSTQGQMSHDIWDSPLLHHFVNMLATLMAPVRYRDEFLAKMKVVSNNPFSSNISDATINWTLVDEDLESEDEESSHNLLLNEADLVELLAQFPFTDLFSHILSLDKSTDKEYNIEKVDSQDILKLIAFSSTLIQIFNTGLETFNRSRYRQFVKRIGRLIRHTVQYVSYHWTNYKTWRLEVCRDSEGTILPGSNSHHEITLQMIQVEIDEMFFRAVQCIMSAPRLGTWQFLADMPYSCLSSYMMWKLLWFLHHSDKGEVCSSTSINVKTRARLDEYKWDLSDSTKIANFGNRLLNMPMSEVIYLLTTFANMASARSNKEPDFVITITNEVYELAYVNKYTRDSCSKVGRELLASVALTHPFIITNIFSLIQSSMDVIGSMSVYLCSELPVHLWKPSVSDMSLLRGWILDHSPDSTKNQLARLILSKLDWGYTEQEDELVLDISLHRKVAILVMEAFTKHIAEKSQGAFIASTISWGISVVLGDVVNLDVWCWDLLNKLRLHSQDQPTSILSASGGYHSKTSEARGTSLSSERDFAPPDLNGDPTLYPVNKALSSKIPLACYIAVAMTKAGHDLEEFLTKGLEYLQNLISAGCYRMCIPLIGKIVPTFIASGCQEYLLQSVKFVSLVEAILTADHQYTRILEKLSLSFQRECTHLFSSMIATLLQGSKKPGSLPGLTDTMLEFWLIILTSCKSWHTNHDVCQVLDATLESALISHKASDVLTQEIFMTHFRKNVRNPRASGLLSSVMSLVSSSSPLPTMTEQYKKEFPWLAYSLMLAETRFLQENGVLQVISQELHANANLTNDQALKRANQQLKSNYLVNANQLPIYRWAQLALDTDIMHPLLPVIWQMFFTLYLERMKAPGGTVERYSIGYRFFQCYSDVTFLKKLKRQLSQTADYHHNASQGDIPEGHFSEGQPHMRQKNTVEGAVGGNEGVVDGNNSKDCEAITDKEIHKKLLKLYQTFLLWLEEPLLHESSLYLPALPDQYDREKLATIFAAQMEPWMEYVDWDRVSYGVDILVTQWLQVTRPTMYRNNSLIAQDQEKEASTHILNHLHQYEKPKPEPDVKAFIAPIREIPDNVLVDHQAMLQLIEGDLQEMLNYANSFSTRESLNVALDLSYIELMPTLYHNSEVETRLEIPCRSAVSSRHRCLGPAKIVVRHQECKLSDAVKRKLDENRTEYKQLSIEMESPPPPIICTAAVHIENAITDLINKSRLSTGEEKVTHNQVGVALLYHLANKMNDDCRHYPPTRQFFTSCIEILGQEFVRPYPEQAQPLLLEILTNHQLAGVLAPNFVPCNCPSSFVHMYTEVVRATVKNMQDLAFMLLTKFDIAYWLEQYHPTHSTCSQLITIITEALVACGGRQDSDSIPLPHYEVYRSHLQTVFLYNFPQHYSFVIHIVMKGMEEKNLKLKILEDVLKTLNCHILPQFGDIGPKQIEKLVQEETLLSVGELEESVVWMGNYFSNQRHSKQDLLRFGLYSHWKDYMPTLSSFLGYLALNFVLKEAKRLQETDGNIDQGIRKLWELVLSLFAPWVGSAEAASSTRPGQFDVVPAWMEGDVDSALVMVTLFIETTSFIQALFHNAQHPATSNVLSLFWSYYVRCMVKKGVREDILYTYHRAMTSLPWTEFFPDVYCMQSMVKMYEEGQESCVLFLASIFHRIQWTGILECIIARGDIQTANLFLSALLSMLIIFSNSPHIMQSQGRNIKVVIAGAHELHWYLIDESCYHSATMWQLRKSNPRFVLEEHSVGSILKLMRAVGGVESKEPPNLRLASKQASYIGLVVGLMCQCSQNREIRAEEFTNPLHGLLYDITIISTSAGPRVDSSSHLCSLLTTVLSLLNGCSPITGAPDAILRGLTSWLATCADNNLVLQIISVACNSLASTKHMAVIIESCIDSYFATVKPPPNDKTHGWASIVSVLQIPQLSHDEFLLQCLEAGSYLTLYAYLAQKLPQCRSLEEETAINTRLLEWCINCKPSRDHEYKLLLWWYKAIELSVRMINFGAPESNVCRSLNNLAPAILTLGEDRKSSGILGALGFGRHSQLSLSPEYSFEVPSPFYLSRVSEIQSMPTVDQVWYGIRYVLTHALAALYACVRAAET
ncbi:ectopic P granules protein 5 homolog isoform X2 [Lytechinus variegatus]|uniref:ectopic P granules protein 5 homolog isoform X2 n=1 Tax=Lytechinus variegatus TaxID=7654 RepID=UPI001BB12845|nr:ectopic P granules protein 5 homolog isoform X2 [Lytechinus variegatus]